MATAKDVAQYILERYSKKINTIKLQKLVYYSQAWSLVWDEEPIFDEDFQAWANGPVVPSLFQTHKGEFEIANGFNLGGDSSNLTPDHKDTIDSILASYGQKTAQWLVNQTHKEPPWRDAREFYEPGERCTNIISKASMQEYYSGL